MRIQALFFAALLLLAAGPRAARADDPRKAARAHYARGLELANKNGYAEALQEFNQAYIVSPEFAVLYNIGQCHVALGHPAEAVEALSRYLHEGGDRIPVPRREKVQSQIQALEAPPPPVAEGTGAAGAARDLARAHVARGTELATRNQYEAALKEFTEAYATSPDVDLLYNIGQCQLALGQPLEAIEAFSRYLREARDRVPPGRSDLVGAQIAMLESRLAELTIVTIGPTPQIDLEGRDLGRAPLARPIRLAAGTYRITLVPDVGPVVHREVILHEAERFVLTVRLPFLPAGWSPATAARVAASAAAAARAAAGALGATEAANVEKARAASSQQGGAGSGQGAANK